MGCSSSTSARQEVRVGTGRSAGQESAGRRESGGRGQNGASATSSARSLSVNEYVTKAQEQQRQGSTPSGPDFKAYARYLGIDPVANRDLLWIATEALNAPLPADWSEHFDSQERVFYYNSRTCVSSWTHPLEHVFREAYKTIVHIQSLAPASAERSEKLRALEQDFSRSERQVHKEISLWSEHTDDQGHTFYYNRQERVSTWTDPRPSFCVTLYLKMKTLRILQGAATDDLNPVNLTDFSVDFNSDTESESNDQALEHHNINRDELSRLTSFPGDEPAVDSEASAAAEEAVIVGNCVVCLSEAATHVIVPCGHQAFCGGCAKNFSNSRKKSKCPCCRTAITQIIKVYVPAPVQISPKTPEEDPKMPNLPASKIHASTMKVAEKYIASDESDDNIVRL